MKELSKLGVEAVLAGKALPGELMVGESLAKYFARLYLHTKDSRDEQLSQRDAQIAALKADFIRLDRQMSVLEQTGITDRDRADKAEAQIAELAKQEPVYQFIMNRPDIDGYIEWVDCNKDYFDSCGDDMRRIVYAAPPAPVVITDESLRAAVRIWNRAEFPSPDVYDAMRVVINDGSVAE
ncbi:hypothetical protein ACP3S8_19950 [Mixta calida]|uniref:hypothetical protein n=1 Tax=Mixta calida TaxID=665913 RepID=UPI003CF489F2